ncbi:O-antigen ligase family protein [Rurimicrobium arvi]|uniref:O-antigen ligase-related domain-containing protein n=1 Tax=Rurimicrobium arvi TaxID=2049916 RepID=A0ABP8MK24_9BACT
MNVAKQKTVITGAGAPLRFSAMGVTAIVLFFAGLIAFAVTDEWIFLIPAPVILYLQWMLKDIRAAYLLLMAAVPLSIHEEFLNNSYSLSLPSEPMIILFATIGVLFLVAKPQSIEKKFLLNPVTWIILLQLVWIPLTILTSEVPLLSLKFLLAKSWYLLCFFVFPVWILRSKRDFAAVFICWLIPLLAYMIIILIKHAMLEFAFSSVDAAIGNLFYKHVDYASVISMFFPFVWAAWALSKNKKSIYRTLLFATLLFFVLSIVLSFTRAAMGGVVFGLIMVACIRLRKVNWVLPAFYAVSLGLVFYFAKDNQFLKYRPHFQETYMRHEFEDHLKATIQGKDMSSVERLYRWIAALRMGADRPLTGFGPHSFYFQYKPYTLSSYRTYVSENYERSTTHNYFLLMLVEQGVPAMVLYAVLMLAAFGRIQYVYHRLKDPFYRTLLLAIGWALGIFFVNNLFSELIETDKIGPMFYLCLSMLVITERLGAENDTSRLPHKGL